MSEWWRGEEGGGGGGGGPRTLGVWVLGGRVAVKVLNARCVLFVRVVN